MDWILLFLPLILLGVLMYFILSWYMRKSFSRVGQSQQPVISAMEGSSKSNDRLTESNIVLSKAIIRLAEAIEKKNEKNS